MDSKVILLIEDGTDGESLIRQVLARNNIANERIVAFGVKGALDFLLGFSGQTRPLQTGIPALVLLDLEIQGIGGLEVLARIRKTEVTRLVPIVVLTSSDDELTISRCYGFGANSVVPKAADTWEFSEAMLQLMMYWLLLNRGPSR